MVKRMLIDATHPEETRVVVLDGTRLEEFDVETSTKKQNKGNIYLAKVVRVEPSLQAAFVDYGGNRHGFLAFSEIHPDYYQIPVADRERLLAEVQRHERHDDDDGGSHSEANHPTPDQPEQPDATPEGDTAGDDAATGDTGHDNGGYSESNPGDASAALPLSYSTASVSSEPIPQDAAPEPVNDAPVEPAQLEQSPFVPADAAPVGDGVEALASDNSSNIDAAASNESFAADIASNSDLPQGESTSASEPSEDVGARGSQVEDAPVEERPVDIVGGGEENEGDDAEDADEDEDSKRRRRFLASRHYKIQEVIKRRQIMLVQVVKEERGNKGAALTTYLSLAGRYCVLMPNSSRGGGVSRKITNATDRRRLKSIMAELDPPKTAAVILRTAGAERSKPEITRDYEYLMRTWDVIRENTLQSRAPALIHEEGNLIKRAIRDVYSKDIEDILVEGAEGYKTAKDFMRMLTPSHSKKVQLYDDGNISLFQRYQVETQLEAINTPVVQLRSGGSIVFGQTEALVAIDVNSGRATRERHIEETALKTNIEAADEIARQLRLRDLAGLVVIDFIDMEENRNNHAVERRLKEALKLDRARIQVGRISHFGLLELSRQRLRPSLIETNFRPCDHCAGTGLIRSTESSSIYALRMIEEEGIRRRSSELTVTVHPDVALYLLNYKREQLATLEARYGLRIFVLGDPVLVQPNLRIDRVKATRPMAEDVTAQAPQALPAPTSEPIAEPEDEIIPEDDVPPVEVAATAEPARNLEGDRGPRSDHDGERNRGGRGRRRRRRGRRDGRDGHRDHATGGHAGDQSGETPSAASAPNSPEQNAETGPVIAHESGETQGVAGEPGHAGEQGREDRGARRHHRGRRGGRRRRREFGDQQGPAQQGDGSLTPNDQVTNDVFNTNRANEGRMEATEPPVSRDGAATEDAQPRKRGFFSAIKETALSWTRSEPTDVAEPRPIVAPPPAPVPVTPPPPPPRVVEPPRPAPPPPVVDEPPAGPPKRGWWSQPKE